LEPIASSSDGTKLVAGVQGGYIYTSNNTSPAIETGYKVSGQDLNEIFASYTGGSQAIETGYKVSGQDLNEIFEPI